MAPVLIAMLLLVVLAGRVATLGSDVRAAARDGARAASVRGDAASGAADAESVVHASLDGRAASCVHRDVDVDSTRFAPGGEVRVTVTCSVELSDLSLLALPGSRTVTASSVSVIDTHRSGS